MLPGPLHWPELQSMFWVQAPPNGTEPGAGDILFLIKYGMVKAATAIITPITPHSIAFLAVLISPGSPSAFKNKNPAQINIIMAKAMNTIHRIPKMLVIIFMMVWVLAPRLKTGLIPASKAAKVMAGITVKAPKQMMENIFLFFII